MGQAKPATGITSLKGAESYGALLDEIEDLYAAAGDLADEEYEQRVRSVRAAIGRERQAMRRRPTAQVIRMAEDNLRRPPLWISAALPRRISLPRRPVCGPRRAAPGRRRRQTRRVAGVTRAGPGGDPHQPEDDDPEPAGLAPRARRQPTIGAAR